MTLAATFVLGKVTTTCQEKYSPDCCQHGFPFLLLLMRGQVVGPLLTQIGLVACKVTVSKSKKDRSQSFWLRLCVCVCA